MKTICIKKIYLCIIAIFLALAANAQDYAAVDKLIMAYPKSFSSTDKLAERISKDFAREDEKARAIFTWIATNVKYDMQAYTLGATPVAYSFSSQEEKLAKQRKFKTDLAEKTLKTKKGVCQGYATLYEVVAAKVGLQAVMVPGTSKSHPTHIGKKPGASDHAWNAVKVNGKWQLLDATWAAGTVTGNPLAFAFRFNDSYFFTPPEEFVLNHYPDDEHWLMTNATKEDFAAFPLYYGNYLMGGYEFISPGIGTFTSSKNALLPFSIKNLKPDDSIAYAYSRDNVFKAIHPVKNGDVSEFTIPLTAGMSGYLTIYINQRSVVAYKVTGS